MSNRLAEVLVAIHSILVATALLNVPQYLHYDQYTLLYPHCTLCCTYTTLYTMCCTYTTLYTLCFLNLQWAPAVLRWYYEHATPSDSFLLGAINRPCY
jgi:hypothetical protein